MIILYHIRLDGSKLARWSIDEASVVVGRGELADIRVEDQSLSRQHFVIVREGETWLVEDLNSQNGTWVWGRRVLVAKLHHNDRILAGRTWFQFAEQVAVSTLCRSRFGPHGTRIMTARDFAVVQFNGTGQAEVSGGVWLRPVRSGYRS